MILPLQSLRFIFAIMIFLHHFPINGIDVFAAGGDCGMAFFMILSGFVLSAGYREKVLQDNFSGKKFFFNRFVKIYPVHLLCLLFFILVLSESHTAQIFRNHLSNFLLIQSWNPNKVYYFNGNDVSWFLSDLIFFYLMFPAIIRIKNLIPLKWRPAALIPVFAIYFAAVFNVDEAQNQALIYINPAFRIVDFIIGTFLYDLYDYIIHSDKRTKNFSLNSNLYEICAVILFAGVILMSPAVPEKIRFASLYWIPSCILILIFALGGTLHGGILSKALSNKRLAALGSISFCFYMVQKMIIDYFTDAETGLDLHWSLQMAFCFAAALLIGWLLHILIEKPVAKLLRIK